MIGQKVSTVYFISVPIK